ncbi:MAG: hypothetical protein WC450_10475 [Candidatus Omnitrophota bacterium]|jgi:hypothetical protein
MELVSSKGFLTMFRDKIRPELLFPPWFASRHASFIMSCHTTMTPDAFNELCLRNWDRTTALFDALLNGTSEKSIREILERMTPKEAAFYEDRLRLVDRWLSEGPETFVQRGSPTDEMFWIDLLKRLLVIPCPPPV